MRSWLRSAGRPLIWLVSLSVLAFVCLKAYDRLQDDNFSKNARSHVKHIVIIVQENRSFDNLFHGFPGADTANYGLAHDGAVVRLRPISLRAQYDLSNGAYDFVRSYDNGKMDGWDHRPVTLTMSTYTGPYPQFGFVPHSESRPYFNLARAYVLADRMFQSNIDQSFAAHLYLIASNAARSVNVPSGRPWGCDAWRGTWVRTLGDDRKYAGRAFPCFDLKTLGDELVANGFTWRYYAPRLDSAATWAQFAAAQRHGRGAPRQVPEFGQLWTAYDAIAHVRYGAQWITSVVSPERRFLVDIKKGELANVTWIVPDYANSDHSGSRSATGPSWVTAVINAVGQSSFWNNTVIFVTWDDAGGWYDHVPPPYVDYDGLGSRVPLIIVSPYAKRGYISHRVYEFSSILKFSERVFSLPPLGPRDRNASDFIDTLDFASRPREFEPFGAPFSRYVFLTQRGSGQPPDD